MKYYKNLSIDESDFSVQRQGCRIHLTTTEYQLFITLLDHSGHICSRNFLLDIFLVYPDVSVTVIGVIFGLLITVLGGVLIYTYLKRREIPLFRFNLIYGILRLAFCIIVYIGEFGLVSSRR